MQCRDEQRGVSNAELRSSQQRFQKQAMILRASRCNPWSRLRTSLGLGMIKSWLGKWDNPGLLAVSRSKSSRIRQGIYFSSMSPGLKSNVDSLLSDLSSICLSGRFVSSEQILRISFIFFGSCLWDFHWMVGFWFLIVHINWSSLCEPDQPILNLMHIQSLRLKFWIGFKEKHIRTSPFHLSRFHVHFRLSSLSCTYFSNSQVGFSVRGGHAKLSFQTKYGHFQDVELLTSQYVT